MPSQGGNPLPALVRTALADPKTAIPLVLFALMLLSAMAKLIGAALLVGTIGVATKPDPASFAPFIKGWMKKRFALNRRVAAPGSSNIVNSVASTLSGWMDKATAAVIASTHAPHFDDCTVAVLARLHISEATAENAGLADSTPLAAQRGALPRGTRELTFLGLFGHWVLVPGPLVERMRSAGLLE